MVSRRLPPTRGAISASALEYTNMVWGEGGETYVHSNPRTAAATASVLYLSMALKPLRLSVMIFDSKNGFPSALGSFSSFKSHFSWAAVCHL